ncbi:hypothetical protein CYMTET_24068 [Cymbomonas tetramitiformis]|uniref:Uncharacterized protein n=1 Tax=Cymbomonas tetramitiformis TaxID=36881 RepID=A0AAE0FX89_9CHLO|nr:hypothetical protein CYMTET_24068 [Cymbomonas tetramitiformis]
MIRLFRKNSTKHRTGPPYMHEFQAHIEVVPGTPGRERGASLRRHVVLLSNGAVSWRQVPAAGTSQPPTILAPKIPSDANRIAEYAWPYIMVYPSGDLRRWERTRTKGWVLVDATNPKEFVAPFDLDDSTDWQDRVQKAGNVEIPAGDLRDEETLNSVVKRTPPPESVEFDGMGANEKEEEPKDPGSPLCSLKSPSYDPVSPPYDLGLNDDASSKEVKSAGVTAATEMRAPSAIEANPPISENSYSEEEGEWAPRRKKANVE